MRECNKGCNPETDDSTIDCDGNYILSECITTNKVPYLGINTDNSPLSTFIEKIVNRLKGLTNSLGSIWNLPEYTNDTAASLDGLPLGKPYVTPTGEVRIRKV